MTRPGEARRDRIVDYLRHRAAPSSFPEIASGTEISAGSSLFRHLQILRDRGVITWDVNRQRTLRLIEARIPGVVDDRPGWWTPEVRA